MAGGVVLGALEGQERVDGRYRRRVCGAKANLGAAQTIGGLIGDLGAAGRHDGCAWDYLGVHLKRSGKVSGSKRCRDVAHVLSDRDDPSGVRRIVGVKVDPPTIHEVLKHVRRSVLIHAHDRVTACLHRRECAIGLAPGGFAPAPTRSERDREGNGPDFRGAPTSGAAGTLVC